MSSLNRARPVCPYGSGPFRGDNQRMWLWRAPVVALAEVLDVGMRPDPTSLHGITLVDDEPESVEKPLKCVDGGDGQRFTYLGQSDAHPWIVPV